MRSDHRIELYHHATQVLVERWNRIRSPDATRHTPPIKAADAIRLLGPVALRGIEQGGGGAISEARLREIIGPVLATGHVKGVANPDEAIEIFRRSLGLLVEKAPGLYGFLHLTLGEYFAARELVRGPGLDELAADKKRAFEPQWREVLLLAIGELGVLQADDARVEALVDMLLAGTRRPHRPSPGVPSLLAGLLADDPNLGPAHAQRVVETLVPTWWFVRKYWEGSVLLAIHDATKLVGSRLRHGRFGALLAERVERTYGDGVPRKVQESFARLGANAAAAHAALEAFVRAATSEDPRGP